MVEAAVELGTKRRRRRVQVPEANPARASSTRHFRSASALARVEAHWYVDKVVAHRSQKIALLVVCGLVLPVLVSCSIVTQTRTFAELAADASAVPVPTGVTFVREVRSVEDGPGFTTASYKEVSRNYVSGLSCQILERTWANVLRRTHREFRVDNVPHKFGAIGSLGIVITDRPENLGITLGTDNGACGQPFVYSFNNPH